MLSKKFQALEALFFYVPTIVWRFLTWQTGIHVQSIVNMACESRILDHETRDRAFKSMAVNIQEAIHVKNQVGYSTKTKLIFNFSLALKN